MSLSTQVIIKPETVNTMIGSLHLPEAMIKRPQRGYVIRKGKDVSEINIGDEVFFGDNPGTVICLEDETCLLFQEEQIMLVIK